MVASITALTSYVPTRILSNSDLEKMVDTSDEWIYTRTGIKNRFIADHDEFTSTMGIKVAQDLFNKHQLSPGDIEAIIVATMTPDYHMMPATSCIIQDALGAKNAFCFDLPVPCSGFIYALAIAKAFVESNMLKNVLVIASEKMSSALDYTDRSTCVLFGDGATAALVSSLPGLRLGHFSLGSDGSFADILTIPAGGCRMPASTASVNNRLHALQMKGKGVFKQAVLKMFQSSKAVLDLEGLTEKDIAWVIPHQANLRIIKALAEKFSAIDLNQVYSVVDRYGNTSCASIGIALDSFLQSSFYEKEDRLLFTAFGGGMTWGSCVVTIDKRIDIE